MISGTRKRALEALAVAFTAALMLATAAPAWAFDLPALMALLGERKSGEARFTEERTVSTLDSPLYSSGTLSFAAPDRFARRTTVPRPESMEVEGDTVVMQRGGRTRRIALDAAPELGALVDAMRGTLTGNAQALQKHFQVGLEGTAAKWVLRLQPLEARLATQVRSVEIAGQGGEIRSVELRLAGGDRSLMLVEPLPPSAPSAASAALR